MDRMEIYCIHGAIIVLAMGTWEGRVGGGNSTGGLRTPTFPPCQVTMGSSCLHSQGERCHESERPRKSYKTWQKRSCSSVSKLREETKHGHREDVEFGENTLQKTELRGAVRPKIRPSFQGGKTARPNKPAQRMQHARGFIVSCANG